MFALVSTGNLLAPRGSAEMLVDNMAIDRGSIATVISKLVRHEWGITLLAAEPLREFPVPAPAGSSRP